MLANLYVDALLADENQADLIWELWNAGVITDEKAALSWFMLVTTDLKRGAKDEI